MKKLLFLSLLVMTACSPVDDYISKDEFSEKMRKIEKMHGDEYTAQDFKYAKKAVFEAEKMNSSLMVEEQTYRQLLENAKSFRIGYESELSAYNSAMDNWKKTEKSYEISIEKIEDKGAYIALGIRVSNNSFANIEKLDLKISKEGDSTTSQIYDIQPNSSLIYHVDVKPHHFDYKNRYELTMPMLYHLEATYYKGIHAPKGMHRPVAPENPFKGYL